MNALAPIATVRARRHIGAIAAWFGVRFFIAGLNFTFSRRPGVRTLFLFRVVTYRDGFTPAARASVHSRIMISRGMAESGREWKGRECVSVVRLVNRFLLLALLLLVFVAHKAEERAQLAAAHVAIAITPSAAR